MDISLTVYKSEPICIFAADYTVLLVLYTRSDSNEQKSGILNCAYPKSNHGPNVVGNIQARSRSLMSGGGRVEGG